MQKTVSLPLERVVEIERFAERTERKFSQAASYLMKMGLVYVLNVLPAQQRESGIDLEAEKASKNAFTGRTP